MDAQSLTNALSHALNTMMSTSFFKVLQQWYQLDQSVLHLYWVPESLSLDKQQVVLEQNLFPMLTRLEHKNTKIIIGSFEIQRLSWEDFVQLHTKMTLGDPHQVLHDKKFIYFAISASIKKGGIKSTRIASLQVC